MESKFFSHLVDLNVFSYFWADGFEAPEKAVSACN